jgi:hypothetical protein
VNGTLAAPALWSKRPHVRSLVIPRAPVQDRLAILAGRRQPVARI